MKYLVLGHSGFVGSEIYSLLKKTGNIQVTGLSSSQIDLSKRKNRSVFAQRVDRDTAVILAVGSPIKSLDSFDKNIRIYTNILKSFSLSPPQKILLVSSLAIFGENRTRTSLTEDSPFSPSSLYGIAKLTIEELTRVCCSELDIPFLVLRPGRIFGPGDTRTYGPGKMIKECLLEDKISLMGEGNEERDYVYVSDFAKLVLRFLRTRHTGYFNISSGVSVSSRTLANKILTLSGSDAVIVKNAARMKPVKIRVNPRKLFTTFPEFNFTSLDTALLSTLRTIRRTLPPSR